MNWRQILNTAPRRAVAFLIFSWIAVWRCDRVGLCTESVFLVTLVTFAFAGVLIDLAIACSSDADE